MYNKKHIYIYIYIYIHKTWCVRGRHKKNIQHKRIRWHFCSLLISASSGQISRKSVNSTYPINSFKEEGLFRKTNTSFRPPKICEHGTLQREIEFQSRDVALRGNQKLGSKQNLPRGVMAALSKSSLLSFFSDEQKSLTRGENHSKSNHIESFTYSQWNNGTPGVHSKQTGASRESYSFGHVFCVFLL